MKRNLFAIETQHGGHLSSYMYEDDGDRLRQRDRARLGLDHWRRSDQFALTRHKGLVLAEYDAAGARHAVH